MWVDVPTSLPNLKEEEPLTELSEAIYICDDDEDDVYFIGVNPDREDMSYEGDAIIPS